MSVSGGAEFERKKPKALLGNYKIRRARPSFRISGKVMAGDWKAAVVEKI